MTNVNLISTGKLATEAGVPHARILKAIDELRLVPAVTLNSDRYFDANGVERIEEKLARQRGSRSGASEPADDGDVHGSSRSCG